MGLGYEAKISIAQASGTEGSFCSFCCAGRLGVWAEGQPRTSSPGAVDHSPACPLGMLLQPGPCKLPTHRSGAHLHSVGPVFLAPHTPFLDGSSDTHRRGVLRGALSGCWNIDSLGRVLRQVEPWHLRVYTQSTQPTRAQERPLPRAGGSDSLG